MECSYQTHLPSTCPRLMFLTIDWEIGWILSPTCPQMWKSNYLQGQEDGSSARVISGSPNSNPREGVAAAEEEAAGGDVAAAEVTNMYLTGTTHPLDGLMEWTATTSGEISPAKSLTRLGVMGAYIYSTSARVTSTPATYRRLSNTGKIMVRS